MPLNPSLPDGYFHRELVSAAVRVSPSGPPFLGGPPTGMLIAPRPMWIVDGIDDLDKPADQRPQWRRDHQRGRDQIRTASGPATASRTAGWRVDTARA